jgi:hypothetical protein
VTTPSDFEWGLHDQHRMTSVGLFTALAIKLRSIAQASPEVAWRRRGAVESRAVLGPEL